MSNKLHENQQEASILCIYDTPLLRMTCAGKPWNEQQLEGLVQIVDGVVFLTAEQRTDKYKAVELELAQGHTTALHNLLHRIGEWQTEIEGLLACTPLATSDANKVHPPTWTAELLNIVTTLREDIGGVIEAHKPIQPLSRPAQVDLADETRSLIAERKQRVETAQDYAAETCLKLLLHMFDVPRKKFKYTSHMKIDWNDPDKREKIDDFYPTDENFYLLLYTDPDNRRDSFQKQESINDLLRHCAVCLLLVECPVQGSTTLRVDDRATKLAGDLRAVKCRCDAGQLARHRQISAAVAQLIQLYS